MVRLECRLATSLSYRDHPGLSLSLPFSLHLPSPCPFSFSLACLSYLHAYSCGRRASSKFRPSSSRPKLRRGDVRSHSLTVINQAVPSEIYQSSQKISREIFLFASHVESTSPSLNDRAQNHFICPTNSYWCGACLELSRRADLGFPINARNKVRR